MGPIEIMFNKLYKTIEDQAPSSREKNIVLTKLDEAMMWFERIDWFDPEKDNEIEEANV